MNNNNIYKKDSLTEADFAQIRDLEATCNRAEGINVKLNWGLMKMREAGKISDFCYVEQDQLLGYMPLDGFGDQFEITAIVLPGQRQRGIFKLLLAAARQVAIQRRALRLLLVNYRAAQSGTAAVKALNLPYSFSEYHLEAKADLLPPLPASHVSLREVTVANVADLADSLASTFSAGEWNNEASLLADLKRKDGRYFLAEIEGMAVGQIGVVTDAEEVYIRGVGILPEWRGRGFGRQLLSATVQKMLGEGFQHFALDVETNNSNALSLYQSCGFGETNVYDYYNVALDESEIGD